jgi:hypothetical protein
VRLSCPHGLEVVIPARPQEGGWQDFVVGSLWFKPFRLGGMRGHVRKNQKWFRLLDLNGLWDVM